jgi:hypothetical protein
MFTIVETPVFQRLARDVWNEDELDAFKVWLAHDPLAGEVVPGSGGLRKVRWSRAGMGKRGGARVIYYNQLSDGVIALLMIYTKTKFDNLPTEFLSRLRKEFEDAQS